MIELIERVQLDFRGDWADIWRITCNSCGASKEGIDVLSDCADDGWFGDGTRTPESINECPACIASVWGRSDA